MARMRAKGLGMRSRRLRATLDAMPTNCMVADRRLRLIYMNRRSAETLATLEPVVQEAFGLGADELLGGSIDRFHRDPDRIERLLSDPSNFPHRAVLSFGRVRLQAEFNVIRGVGGRVVGYVVAWTDATTTLELLDHVVTVSSDLADISESLARDAGVTSDEARMVATGAGDMQTTIAQIAESAGRATSESNEAAGSAASAATAIDRLEVSSQSIGGVIDLIAQIAGQTKLLALNATIEASRAGEAGRGFSVVASEVRQLATETGAATERITEQIRDMREDVFVTAQAMRDLQARTQTINDMQVHVAAAIEEQSATSSEMSRGIAKVADSSQRTTEISGSIAGMVSSTEAQVRSLRTELRL